jgi:hypothetical protein
MADAEMPPELRAFIDELDAWATLNERDVRRDTIRFWALKLPAIVSSASAGVLALEHLGTIAAILAAVSRACVLIDAVNPGGQLRNAPLRAVVDLRELEYDVVNNWRIGSLQGAPSGQLAVETLQGARKVRERIFLDLKMAETSFAQAPADKRNDGWLQHGRGGSSTVLAMKKWKGEVDDEGDRLSAD